DEVKYTEKRLWEKIYEKTKLIRRTGIGLLGEDETVEAMNLRNGSHNAADFLADVYRSLALSVYSSSVQLAKERGTFGIYNGEKETENAFINRIKDADASLFAEMQKYGRRNISCLASVRSEKKSLAALAHLPVIQEREGNDGIAKLKLYGELQKWSDHAVAVDIMLSAKADESLASKLYIEAWRNGCWVCNVRCEKNEETEPMSKDSVVFKQPIITEVRPQSLECDVVRFQNNKEKWVAFVGLLDGYPYEIFTGLQDDEEGIVLPKSVTKGKIIKNVLPDGTKRYDFQFQNKRGYKTTVEGLSEKFNKEYWNYAKLISGVLRYRMPTHYVIKLVGSLQLESESINTWKNGVKQALKKYVVNGTEAKGVMCPNCGSESLVYQDGNLICKECGEIR
ncbi:MAG: ribonucleoside-diphosphate reductase, adenosylcobalamin-dependent, partial [Bacteroidaceae bacterium]|nr:ribonucleoside-diphosphate reductase, adenosylcobalamin-dependent [Bacteroidaceae bacterium]